MKAVYGYANYREFLIDFLTHQRNEGWGWQNRIAIAIGTRSQFVSQVLRGRVHLSLEHAELASGVLKFDEDEKEYFIFLVLHARATTEGLRQFAKENMNRILRRHNIEPPELNLHNTL